MIEIPCRSLLLLLSVALGSEAVGSVLLSVALRSVLLSVALGSEAVQVASCSCHLL